MLRVDKRKDEWIDGLLYSGEVKTRGLCEDIWSTTKEGISLYALADWQKRGTTGTRRLDQRNLIGLEAGIRVHHRK